MSDLTEKRLLFLAALEAAENAIQEGKLEWAALLLPPEGDLWVFQGDEVLLNRYWIAHAVAHDRLED